MPSDTKRRRRRKCAICGGVLPPPRKGHHPGPPFVYCSDGCREASKICTVPGCTTQRSGGKVCTYHKKRIENDYCNVYCKLCGYGPRVKLYVHVNREHDGTKAYAERFGQNALVSDGYRALRRTVYGDAAKNKEGLPAASPRRRRVCRNGHAMRGDNVMISTSVVNGREYTLRQCRKCAYKRMAKWKRAKRAANRPAWRDIKRKCDWCGRKYLPHLERQRFCCPEHKSAYHRALRKPE